MTANERLHTFEDALAQGTAREVPAVYQVKHACTLPGKAARTFIVPLSDSAVLSSTHPGRTFHFGVCQRCRAVFYYKTKGVAG